MTATARSRSPRQRVPTAPRWSGTRSPAWGHAWPGDARVVASETAPVIAADVIWDFFERHPRTGGDP
jgi:hypothetical protein